MNIEFLRNIKYIFLKFSTKTFIMDIRNVNLIHNKAYVNGEWICSKSGKTFSVVNPATGGVIGDVPDMDVPDVKYAIKSANDAFLSWSSMTAKERGILLREWYNRIAENSEELAKIITLEAGKPLVESVGEVTYANSFIEWFSEEARRINGEVIQSPSRYKEMVLIKQPIGVAALITPWNFPLAMITRKVGAALAAGCTCVIKPAEDTPFTALALCDLAEKACIPKGVINVVTVDRPNAAITGKEFCENPLIAGLSFTGSTEVGKNLYQQCAGGIKRVSLELGGNAPFIVFDTADLDKAVDGAMACKFRNCGQTCVSANRFLIQEDVFEDFLDKITLKVNKLKIGNGMQHGINLGPLINKAQINKVEGIVNDAISKGATLICGGERATEIGNQYYKPTILTDITSEMSCYVEEIFGPVVVCIKFCTEDEAIDIANSTRRGLAGYFYSNDITQVWRVARKLEVGMVGVNEGIISSAEAAFGGVKESGIGREGSHYGIDSFVNIKCICFGNLDSY